MKRLIPVFFVMAAFSFSFAGSANGQTAKLPKWLPPDFDPKNGVLLIEKANTPGVPGQKKIEEYMEKNYPYKYEFVDIAIVGGGKEPTIVNAEKYADKNVYRFVMANSVTTILGIPRSDGSRAQGSVFDYCFIDRLNDKAYPQTGSSTSWAFQAFKRIMGKVLKLKTE